MYGCPYRGIDATATLFYSDFADIQKGVLLPYHPNEAPARFMEMKDIYAAWLPYLRRKAAERDNPPPAADGIEAFRAEERARNG